MHKSISFLLPLFILLMSFGAQAQLAVGLRIGGNLANQKTEINGLKTATQPKSLFVWNLAGAFEIPVTTMFSVQPEVHFTQKGSKTEIIDSLGILTFKCKYNYVEVPIMLKLDIDSGDGKLYLVTGPVFGYGLGGTETISLGQEEIKSDIDFKDRFSPERDRFYDRTDFGMAFGGGVEVPTNFGKIVLDFRYALAFNDTWEEMNNITGEKARLLNRGVRLSIGAMYDLNKGK